MYSLKHFEFLFSKYSRLVTRTETLFPVSLSFAATKLCLLPEQKNVLYAYDSYNYGQRKYIQFTLHDVSRALRFYPDLVT